MLSTVVELFDATQNTYPAEPLGDHLQIIHGIQLGISNN